MHPSNLLLKLNRDLQAKLIWLLLITTLSFAVIMNFLGAALKNEIARSGIIAFELAKDFSISQKILNSWDSVTQLYAAFGLGFDYLFLCSYSCFFALLCFKLADRFASRNTILASIGLYLAYLQFLAGIFDSLENYFLIELLFGSQNRNFPLFAYYSASAKFILIFTAIVYNLFSWFYLALNRKQIRE